MEILQRWKIFIQMAMALLGLIFRQTWCEEHRVGDGIWTIPPDQNYYANWSSSVHFLLHDKLVFEFESEFHELMQVPRLGYDNCNVDSPIKVFTSSPVVIVFTEPGLLYFICNVSDHCLLGQKISVVVQAQPSNLPPTPSPSPSPSPTPLPLSSPSPSPFPPSFLPPPLSPSPVTGPSRDAPAHHSGQLRLFGICSTTGVFALITLLLLLH